MIRPIVRLRTLLLPASLLVPLLLAVLLSIGHHGFGQTPPPVATALPSKPVVLNAAEDLPKADFVETRDPARVPPAPAPSGSVNPNPPGTPGAPNLQGPPPEPFGSRLFTGNFLRTRQDGLNPDYLVMPGDRVMVNTWGAIEGSNVYLVDAQGNIFMPNVGPIQIAGTRNADVTAKVRAGLSRVYARNFEVYTNLLTAKPVAVFVTGGVVRPGRYAGVPPTRYCSSSSRRAASTRASAVTATSAC